MTPDEVAFFKRVVAKVLEEAHPCDAARVLGEALEVITGLANERDELRKKLSQKPFETLTGDAFRMPLVSWAAKMDRPGRVWFDSSDEHSLVDLFKVRDHEGDHWVPEDKANPEGKWLMVNYRGEFEGSYHSSFDSLLREWKPLVEVDDNLEQAAWYSEDGHADDYCPDKVEFVRAVDSAFVWTRVNENLWRASDQTDDDVKEDGYWTFTEIVDEHGPIYQIPTGPTYQRLTWKADEPEPHERIKYVRTPARFYWKHTENGWVCPHGGRIHAREEFGKETVSWEELTAKWGHFEEYFK